jgi:glycerol kinase
VRLFFRVMAVAIMQARCLGRSDRDAPSEPFMTRYVLALDQGTTSSRAILFRDDGGIVAVGQHEFPQIYPQPGWVEHDPEALWRSQLRAARDAIEGGGISPSQIAAIGIANQRETVVLWDRRTLEPVANALVWQDRRTAPHCEDLRSRGLEGMIAERTGLVIDAYFSGTKLAWLLDNVPGARLRAERGELAAGTIDAWLIARLTNGGVHATDPTNASRTMLFDIDRCAWDEDLLRLLRVPAAVLPDVRPSCGDFGVTAAEHLGAPIAITGVAGDQQAALVGQGCFAPGAAKNTYGTGSFLLLVTDGRPAGNTDGLLTTLTAAGIVPGPAYALEGSIFITGAAVQWLRDGLGLIASAAESEAVAASVATSDGVYVVPAFVGLGAPHWDMYARGAILGLTRGSSKGHIVRATLESIAFQSVDVIESMERASGVRIEALQVDGGATANDLLMQMQADYLGRPVDRPAITETTAAGAAYLAGLSAGIWRSLADVAALRRIERRFEPAISEAERQAALAGWRRAVDRTKGWLDE